MHLSILHHTALLYPKSQVEALLFCEQSLLLSSSLSKRRKRGSVYALWQSFEVAAAS